MVKPVVFPQVNFIKTPQGREATPLPAPEPQVADKTAGGGFDKMVGQALERVDSELRQADLAVNEFVRGKLDIQQMALSLERADLSLRLLTRVRNRVIDAYREISRMNI